MCSTGPHQTCADGAGVRRTWILLVVIDHVAMKDQAVLVIDYKRSIVSDAPTSFHPGSAIFRSLYEEIYQSLGHPVFLRQVDERVL